MRCLGRAKQRDQGIGDHLHDHHTACQHEQREQEQRISGGLRCRNEQQAACQHGEQTGHGPAHITDPLDQLRAGNADHQIRREKAELHQHGLREIEREQLFELGNDDIVERRDATEDQEQRENETLQARCVNMLAWLFDFVRIGTRRYIGGQSHDASSANVMILPCLPRHWRKRNRHIASMASRATYDMRGAGGHAVAGAHAPPQRWQLADTPAKARAE